MAVFIGDFDPMRYKLKQYSGGAGGIRTLDRALQPYNGLANRRLQPLGHSSGKADMPDAGASRKRQIPGCRIRQPFDDFRPSIEALNRNLEAEAERSGHRFVMRVSQMRPEYGAASFGLLGYAHLPSGFWLRAFEVRVRRRLSSDFEKAPLDSDERAQCSSAGYSRSTSEMAFEPEK
jgi:hypothetical protein